MNWILLVVFLITPGQLIFHFQDNASCEYAKQQIESFNQDNKIVLTTCFPESVSTTKYEYKIINPHENNRN